MRVYILMLIAAVSVFPLPGAGDRGPEAAAPAAPDPREVFLAGNINAARRQVETLLEGNANDARLLALLGDISFRQARFSDAEQAYRLAVKADGRNARGHWGLGRLEKIASHQAAARDHIAAAFQLDPRDPDIVLAYADFVQDLRSRTMLLRNFLSLAGSGNGKRERREEAAAQLEIFERVGRLNLGRLASPYQPYRMKLAGYFPDGRAQSGLLISVSLNRAKPLRLILDSGADGIFVKATDARAANIERLTADRIVGAGSAPRTDDYVGLARNVRIGNLELEDNLVHVTEAKLFPGADGVIGTNVFERFLVRLDPSSLVLDLSPLPGCASENMMQAFRVGHLLLVRASDNNYFMLDTGASFSVTTTPEREPRMIEVRGAQGRVEDARHARPMRLNVAGRHLIDEKPVSLDLSELGQRQGVEISGIIGYPLLGRSVLTINYRDGLVDFGRPDR